MVSPQARPAWPQPASGHRHTTHGLARGHPGPAGPPGLDHPLLPTEGWAGAPRRGDWLPGASNLACAST